jgi:hypothetical protein
MMLLLEGGRCMSVEEESRERGEEARGIGTGTEG